jgi:hypothetical protein
MSEEKKTPADGKKPGKIRAPQVDPSTHKPKKK